MLILNIDIMPNWSATNYCCSGSREELQEFCDMVNSLPNREDVSPNGFGKYWLGNLVSLLGADWEKVSCRGTLNPDASACACFCGPSGSGNGVDMVIGEDGCVRFSTETAWEQSKDFEELLCERFPSFELAYRSTDEFGNFHTIHDPQKRLGFQKYEVYADDLCEVYTDDEQEAVAAILRLAGLNPDDYPGISFSRAEELTEEWRTEAADRDVYVELIQWEEE